MGYLRPAEAWPRAVLTVPLLLLLLWAFSGCEENAVEPADVEPPARTEALFDSVEVPEFWVLGSDEYRAFRVSLDLSQDVIEAVRRGDLVGPSLIVLVEDPSGIVRSQFVLLDDGGSSEFTPDPEYLADQSGDLVPGDYDYQVMLNSSFASEEGTYSFGIAVDGLWSPGQIHPAIVPITDPIIYIDVTVSANEPPVFSDPSLPDSLHAGFDLQQWSVNVVDPNEQSGDEVVDVMVELSVDEVVYRELLFAELDAPVWTFTADSTFAAGLETAEYTMSFTAVDKFDQLTDPPFEHTVWIENAAPELLSLVAPDTAYQPGPDDPPNVYTFELNVEDSQGQGDIEEVYYEVTDPTGNHYGNPAFVFRDDGEDPDPIAGDRIWSHGFSVTNTVSNFGTYTFTFYARDRAGNVSEPIEHFLELIASSEPQP